MDRQKKSCRDRLSEHTTDPDIFLNMASSQPIDDEKFDYSIRIQFPKFSKNFDTKMFDTFIQENVGKEELDSFGRLSFPNEFQMVLKSKAVREKLIRMGRTQIEGRSCWISPLSQSEIRGYVHWLPIAIPNDKVTPFLEPYGEVLFIESQKQAKWDMKYENDSRYFALKLRPGKTKDEICHYLQIENYRALITIRGRKPACFHCKEVGHRKSECGQYKRKLASYSNRPANSAAPRKRPRGKRYDSSAPKEMDEEMPQASAKQVHLDTKEPANPKLVGGAKPKVLAAAAKPKAVAEVGNLAPISRTLAEFQKNLEEQMKNLQLSFMENARALHAPQAEEVPPDSAAGEKQSKKKKKKKKKKNGSKE